MPSAILVALMLLLISCSARCAAQEFGTPTIIEPENPIRSTPPELVLMAKQFEAEKNYASAAKYYELATTPERYPRHPRGHEIEEYLRKAIECAEKAPTFDRSELARFYIKLAEYQSARSARETLRFYEKAASLLNDTDPRKPGLLSSCASLRSLAAQQLSPGNSLTPLQKAEVTAKQCDDLTRAAALAEQNKAPSANGYWLALAKYEAEASRIDQAFEHAQYSIASYSASDARSTTPNQALSDTVFLIPLTENTFRLSELLFQQAVDRVSTVHGAAGIAAQAQLEHFFEFYVHSKSYAKAEVMLDKILKTDLGQGNYSVPNHDSFGCRDGPLPLASSQQVIAMIEDAADPQRNGNIEFDLTILTKLLLAERIQFLPDDRRIAITLSKLASVQFAHGDITKADKTYGQSLAILRQYEPLTYALSSLGKGYFDLLREEGKVDVIEKLESEMRTEKKHF